MNQEMQQRADSEYAGFFSDAAQVLDIARQAQANLDHKAATGFSVFDYFREREEDLSRAFAGLLNPRGEHGQREAFLRCFLDEIAAKEASSGGYPPADENWNIHLEYLTHENRRIDIVLNHPQSGRWLGIENKPWAGEQDRQAQHYLETLALKDKNARIYYFSGDGSDSKTIDVCSKEKCRTVPFRKDGKRPSIEGWVENCLLVCEAEPVRWFLKDLLKYIRHYFSMEGVPTIDYKGDVMTDTMKNFIIDRSGHDADVWDTATLIERAMPEVRVELKRRFVDAIQEHLQGWANENQWKVVSTSDNKEKHMKKHEAQVVLHRINWKFRNPIKDGDGWMAAGVAMSARKNDWEDVYLCVAAPKVYDNDLRKGLEEKRPKDFIVGEDYAPAPIYKNMDWGDEFLKRIANEKSFKKEAKEIANQMLDLALTEGIECIIDKMFSSKPAT